MEIFYPKSIKELQEFIRLGKPCLYYSSRTSTVIPFDRLETLFKVDELTLCDLTSMPKKIIFEQNNCVSIEGPVTWKELKVEALQRGFRIKTMPTEDLATVLAGLATSCTGEHAFGFGTLRSQVMECTYLNYNGQQCKLSSKESFENELKKLLNESQYTLVKNNLLEYQKQFVKYESFKNAPFPRMQFATDLMIGTEGQLGIITNAKIEIEKMESIEHFFITVPRWEVNGDVHIKLMELVQKFRGKILAVEFIDWNSQVFLPQDVQIANNEDCVFFEIRSEYFDEIYQDLFLQIPGINEDKIFQFSEAKFHQFRASIPRLINEFNSRNGILKKGTDVQVEKSQFKELLSTYRLWSKLGIKYNLFGHFGDAHLHFNFLPLPHQVQIVQKVLDSFYLELSSKVASPFAEHGIGFLKKYYIKDFYNEKVITFFADLKSLYDPKSQFFPYGPMDPKSKTKF